MDIESSSSSVMAPLATSSPRKITNYQEWVLEARKLAENRFQKYQKRLDDLEKKLEKFTDFEYIRFCDINSEEDYDLKNIILQRFAESRALANQVKLEQEEQIENEDNDESSETYDSSNYDCKDEVQPSPIGKTLRPPLMNEQVFSQGGSPLYVPPVRPDLPNIQLPMTDGRIYNLVVKEEPMNIPELNTEEIKLLRGLQNFIDKILVKKTPIHKQ